ncbi:uncharacterized protein [Littorina saxatilis]|uniref:Uncharacterized protein n=1 Tax=Littorina saxatilis TaxID=31220 RepID=A0AAN9BGD6_9CAEN
MAGMMALWADNIDSASVSRTASACQHSTKFQTPSDSLELEEQNRELEEILRTSLSLSDTQHLDWHVPETHTTIDFLQLLEGKVITSQELEEQAKERAAAKRREAAMKKTAAGEGRRKDNREEQEPIRWRRRKDDASPFVGHCSWNQVSRMGKRPVPLHTAGLGEQHSHIRTRPPLGVKKVLKNLNPIPQCDVYESWIEQKQILQDDALNAMSLADLHFIHTLCPPGSVHVPLTWDLVARRGPSNPTLIKLELPEDESSTDDNPASSGSSGTQ